MFNVVFIVSYSNITQDLSKMKYYFYTINILYVLFYIINSYAYKRIQS
jgi:hypothetical protein